MSISRQEEVIAVLWAIAALLAFNGEHDTWGWIFAIKAASDILCAIYFGIQENLQERREAK